MGKARVSKRARPAASKQFAVDEDELLVTEDECDEEVAMKGEAEEEDDETPEEARVRLAKQFLSRVEQMEEDAQKDNSGSESDSDAEDGVQSRLKRASSEAKGNLHRRIAQSITSITSTTMRGHRKSATCVSISPVDQRKAFSGAKDGSWIMWDLESSSKIRVHDDKAAQEILAITASPDGNMIATGGRDNLVKLWDVRTGGEPIHEFRHHRDAVTSLAWRRGSPQLFSASMDRTVKVWDVEARSYMDTLFGHQSTVTAVASLLHEKVVSAGLDGTVRLFKVAEQTQLVYRNRATNVDAVAMMSESQFISGDQAGSICVYRAAKKKPSLTVQHAHGAHWITSVGACAFTDLAASGSSDGSLRLWYVSPDAIAPCGIAPIDGFVNGIAFANSGEFVLCAVGQEPRLGRWSTVKAARNGIQLVKLDQSDTATSNEGV